MTPHSLRTSNTSTGAVVAAGALFEGSTAGRDGYGTPLSTAECAAGRLLEALASGCCVDAHLADQVGGRAGGRAGGWVQVQVPTGG